MSKHREQMQPTHRVGDMQIDFIHDGEATFPLAFYQGVDDESWERFGEFIDGDGAWTAVGGWLIRTPDRVIVVDAGSSQRPKPPFSGGMFLQSLRDLGVEPEDVTDVLLTHLHLDHIGWTTLDGRPTFPHARYAMPAAEKDHFLGADYEPLAIEAEFFNPEDAVDVRLAPIAGTAATWDADGELLPGIEGRITPGHSPGQTVLVLRSGGEEGWLVADLAHAPFELLEDDFPGMGDLDPELAARTKAPLVRELVDRAIPFAAGHFGWGRLEERDGGRTWVPLTA